MDDLASAIGEAPAYAAALLTALHERRLIMRFDDTYVPLGVTQ